MSGEHARSRNYARAVSKSVIERKLSEVTGRQLSYFQVPMEMIRGAMGEDAVKMYEWFETTGYSADRAALRRDFPEVPWLPFEAWARAQDWKKLLAG